MHAAVFRYDGVARSTEELLPVGRRVAAVLGQVPGFVTHVLLDAGGGVLLSVSIFDTAADLEVAERLITQPSGDSPTIAWPPPTRLTAGEVIVQRGL
jgi:hypothetical protein